MRKDSEGWAQEGGLAGEGEVKGGPGRRGWRSRSDHCTRATGPEASPSWENLGSGRFQGCTGLAHRHGGCGLV